MSPHARSPRLTTSNAAVVRTQAQATLTTSAQTVGSWPEFAQSSAGRGSHSSGAVTSRPDMVRSHCAATTPPAQATVVLTLLDRTAASPETAAQEATAASAAATYARKDSGSPPCALHPPPPHPPLASVQYNV